jgi:hypothetical protein
MFTDEIIIRKMTIPGQHAIYFVHLAGTQILVRIETPAAGEQALTSQNLMDAGDAAGEPVYGVEYRCIRIGQLGSKREQSNNLSIARFGRC